MSVELTFIDGAQWVSEGRHDILLNDERLMLRCVQHYSTDSENEDSVDGIIEVEPEFIQAIADNENVRGNEVIVIGKLLKDYYLARTFHKGICATELIFLVLNKKSPGQIVYHFEWPLKFFWSNFGLLRPGGCVLTQESIQCKCWVSCSQQLALIVGPATCGVDGTDNYSPVSYPTVKVIEATTMTVKDIKLHLNGRRMWPVNVVFSQTKESTVVMICDSSPQFRYNSFPSCDGGVLVQYDVKTGQWLRVISPASFCPYMLCHVQDNSRIICAETATSTVLWKLWILDAQSLDPIQICPMPDDIESEVDTSRVWHTLIVESLCKKIMYVLFWRYTTWEGQKKSFVLKMTLSHQTHVFTLKEQSRRVILFSLSAFDLKRGIMRLPLPSLLRNYLEGCN